MRNRTLQLAGRLCSIVLLFALAGCGGSVDFFPAYKRLPTTPDPFTFTTQNGVAPSKAINSNAITVSGLTADSSSINIAGSNSKYSINDATAANATDAAGTVKNGDKVIVVQTTPNTLGTSTVSTLTIGGVIGTFTTVTQTVQTPTFTPISQGSTVSSANITSNDSLGAHTVSIIGANSQFKITDATNVVLIDFTTSPQVVSILDSRHIFLNIPAIAGTTTLTIDSTNFQIDNLTLAVTSSPK